MVLCEWLALWRLAHREVGAKAMNVALNNPQHTKPGHPALYLPAGAVHSQALHSKDGGCHHWGRHLAIVGHPVDNGCGAVREEDVPCVGQRHMVIETCMSMKIM